MRWKNQLVAFGLAIVGSSCATAELAPTVERWFDTTRSLTSTNIPTSDVMQIDPNADCELLHDFEIAGKPLELFGAATAEFGDIGNRYQCAWSGDANTSANVRLEVILIDNRSDFDAYANLIPTRDGNTVVATGIGDVQVASFRPNPETPALTTSVLVDTEQRGGVHLVVEILNPNLDFDATDHAELLTRIAGQR